MKLSDCPHFYPSSSVKSVCDNKELNWLGWMHRLIADGSMNLIYVVLFLFFFPYSVLTGLTQVRDFVHLQPARQSTLQDGIENNGTLLLYEEKDFHPCNVTNLFCLGFGFESPLVPSLITSHPAPTVLLIFFKGLR